MPIPPQGWMDARVSKPMDHRSIVKSMPFFATVLALLGALAPAASAHPLSEGSLDVVIHAGRVEVRARVTDDEVSVTNMLSAVPSEPASPKDPIYWQHAS